jgi:hypothetical protein
MKVIIEDFIPGTHQHIYIMEELPYGSPSYIMNTGKIMGGMIEELKNLQGILDKYKETMKDLEGFNRVYSIITQLNGIMTRIPQFMKILGSELEDYMKKYITS